MLRNTKAKEGTPRAPCRERASPEERIASVSYGRMPETCCLSPGHSIGPWSTGEPAGIRRRNVMPHTIPDSCGRGQGSAAPIRGSVASPAPPSLSGFLLPVAPCLLPGCHPLRPSVPSSLPQNPRTSPLSRSFVRYTLGKGRPSQIARPIPYPDRKGCGQVSTPNGTGNVRDEYAGQPPVYLAPCNARLLHRHALGQVPRLVHVAAAQNGRVVGDELKRDRGQ